MAHWLYPVNPDSDYVLRDEGTGAKVPVTVDNLRESIEGSTGCGTWVLSTGFRRMLPGDQVWIYFVQPVQALVALGTAEAIYRSDQRWNVDLTWNRPATRRLAEHPIAASALDGAPQSVRRPSDRGLAAIEAWLAAAPEITVNPDPRTEPMSDEDARQKIIAAIYRRKGQGSFRDSLLDAFDRRCAITGCPEWHVLEAAHIRPYRGEHTNAPGNGLLLRADLHTLFDLKLLSIDSGGRVWVSPRVRDPQYRRLAGAPVRTTTNASWRPKEGLLKEHFDSCQADESIG